MGWNCARVVVQFLNAKESTKIWGLGKLNDKGSKSVLKEKIVKAGTFSDIQLVEQETTQKVNLIVRELLEDLYKEERYSKEKLSRLQEIQQVC